MKGGVKWGQGVVVTEYPVNLRDLELNLSVKAACQKPKIGREELEVSAAHHLPKLGNVNIHRERIARRSHRGEVVKDLSPGPGIKVNGCKEHSVSPPFSIRIASLREKSNKRIGEFKPALNEKAKLIHFRAASQLAILRLSSE